MWTLDAFRDTCVQLFGLLFTLELLYSQGFPPLMWVLFSLALLLLCVCVFVCMYWLLELCQWLQQASRGLVFAVFFRSCFLEPGALMLSNHAFLRVTYFLA